MFDVIKRTEFSRDFIVPDDIAASEASDFTEPGGEPDEGTVGGICEFSGFIGMADFDGNRIPVSVVAG